MSLETRNFTQVSSVLPSPDSSDVHMNKFRFWIVANSAPVETESNITQLRGGYTGNADVNGFPLHVQAVRSHAGGSASQKLIAPGAAISANDVNFRVRTRY